MKCPDLKCVTATDKVRKASPPRAAWHWEYLSRRQRSRGARPLLRIRAPVTLTPPVWHEAQDCAKAIASNDMYSLRKMYPAVPDNPS